jgi:hypothetical protein
MLLPILGQGDLAGHSCRTPTAFHRYGGRDTTECRPRGHTGSSTRTPLQPSGPRHFTIGNRIVVPRRDNPVITVINTPLHGGQWANHSGGMLEPSVAHSCTPMVAHAPSAAHALTMPRALAASLTIADLRTELERHRLGEDGGHITIERLRERHHNLDGDFGETNATAVGQAAHTPTSPGSGVVAWHLPRTSEWWCHTRFLRPKPDAHRMYAQDQVVIHTVRM